jgi:hypothetical protein
MGIISAGLSFYLRTAFVILPLYFEGEGGILFYPCLSVSVCLSVTNFRHSFLSNYSSQMLETLLHYFFCMPYGGIHFHTNLMPTPCLFVRLSVECITKFRRSFLSNYSSRVLEILAHSFWHAIWGNSFLYKSDVNVLFVCASFRRMYKKFSSVPRLLLIADYLKFSHTL